MAISSSLVKLFDYTAKHYVHAAAVCRLANQRLSERLDDFHHFQPEKILDLGCGTGYSLGLLNAKYPTAHIIGVDCSYPVLMEAQHFASDKIDYIQADIELLPFAEHSFDLISANFSLLWIQDLSHYFFNIKKWLRPGGLLLFTGLGPDTFKELSPLSSCYPWGFSDIHTLGDALVSSRWQDVVIDIDRLLVKYKNTQGAYAELEQLGLDSLLEAQPPYQELDKQDIKKGYNITWEIIYGQAWNMELDSFFAEDGEVAIPISQLFEKRK